MILSFLTHPSFHYYLLLTYSAQPGRRAAQPGGVGRGVARVHVDGMTCNKCVNYIQAMPYNPQQYMFTFKNIKRIFLKDNNRLKVEWLNTICQVRSVVCPISTLIFVLEFKDLKMSSLYIISNFWD
jgi:hypothetical protein